MGEQVSPDLRIVPLASTHDRGSFSCGVDSLDAYLTTQAGQDVRRKTNAVFVLVGTDAPTRVLGYVTLCATAVTQGDVPETVRKHLPRYPLVSGTRIGRLAVATPQQGQGVGGILLALALRKAYESANSVGACMAIVDAIDERAARFYAAHGFVRLPESMRLILPMRMIEKLLTGKAPLFDAASHRPTRPRPIAESRITPTSPFTRASCP
jgi:ribosomal protein S18 acetylase RimI-like enzyme